MKLKTGVEIRHKKKSYAGEIPDEIFKEIYGSLGADEKENKKLFAEKKKKFEFEAEKDQVKDEPEKSSD